MQSTKENYAYLRAKYGLLEAGLNLYPVMKKKIKVAASLKTSSNHSYLYGAVIFNK